MLKTINAYFMYGAPNKSVVKKLNFLQIEVCL